MGHYDDAYDEIAQEYFAQQLCDDQKKQDEGYIRIPQSLSVFFNNQRWMNPEQYNELKIFLGIKETFQDMFMGGLL